MRLRVALLAPLAGCSSILGIGTFQLGDAGGGDVPTDERIIDAAPDIAIDVAPGCVGPSGWAVCLAANIQPVVLTGNFSTDTATACASPTPASWTSSGQPDACVVEGSTITVSSMLVVAGSRPLVLAANDTIAIEKLLSRASDVGPGAGAPSPSCAAFASTPQAAGAGGAGGAGGSFRTQGGDGGSGSSTTVKGGMAAAADTAAPAHLRAGCNGQLGATGSLAGGAGGFSGGAIYVVAGSSITVSSLVDVSGAGGRGGTGNGGAGGGGGTGGSIVLYASTIDASGATLIANGGGGGGGATGAAGSGGGAPSANTPTTPAPGGNSGGGSTTTGAGGAGFAGTTDAASGHNGTLGIGGGGGGGASGYIRANKTLTGATLSPAADIVP